MNDNVGAIVQLLACALTCSYGRLYHSFTLFPRFFCLFYTVPLKKVAKPQNIKKQIKKKKLWELTKLHNSDYFLNLEAFPAQVKNPKWQKKSFRKSEKQYENLLTSKTAFSSSNNAWEFSSKNHKPTHVPQDTGLNETAIITNYFKTRPHCMKTKLCVFKLTTKALWIY